MEYLRFAGVIEQLSGICELAVSQFLHHTNSWRPKKRQSQNSWSSSPHSWRARHKCLEPPWCSSSGCSCDTRINRKRTHGELKVSKFLITSFPISETSANLAYLDTCRCVRVVRHFNGLGFTLVYLVFGDRFWMHYLCYGSPVCQHLPCRMTSPLDKSFGHFRSLKTPSATHYSQPAAAAAADCIKHFRWWHHSNLGALIVWMARQVLIFYDLKKEKMV